jgi:hypothetical protein
MEKVYRMAKSTAKTPSRPTKKATKRPKKRGPKEERLIITEDPEVALAMLLRPKKK